MGLPPEAKDALRRIGDAIQAEGPSPGEADGPAGDTAILTKWIAVAEWATPDGTRWLSRLSPEETTSWDRSGMLHDALNGTWPDDEND